MYLTLNDLMNLQEVTEDNKNNYYAIRAPPNSNMELFMHPNTNKCM